MGAYSKYQWKPRIQTVLLQVRTEHFITFHHIWQTFAAGINDSNCKCCCQVHLPYLTMLSIVLIQSAYATKPKYFQQEWKNRCMSYIYIYIHIYITIHIFSPLRNLLGWSCVTSFTIIYPKLLAFANGSSCLPFSLSLQVLTWNYVDTTCNPPKESQDQISRDQPCPNVLVGLHQTIIAT